MDITDRQIQFVLDELRARKAKGASAKELAAATGLRLQIVSAVLVGLVANDHVINAAGSKREFVARSPEASELATLRRKVASYLTDNLIASHDQAKALLSDGLIPVVYALIETPGMRTAVSPELARMMTLARGA